MAKKRIAILGGGGAALSAAYHLTRTPELRAQHDVTIYQMGWRLGGQGASGRNRDRRSREIDGARMDGSLTAGLLTSAAQRRKHLRPSSVAAAHQ